MDITIVDFDTRCGWRGTSRRSFARVVERIRQQKAERRDGAVRRDRRLSRRCGGPGRAGTIMLLYTDGGDTHSALRFRRAAGPAEAPRTSPCTRLASWSISLRPASRRSSGPSCGRWPRPPAARRSFRSSVKELEAVYDKVLAQIRAQYTLGYTVHEPPAPTAPGGRSRSGLHGPERRRRQGPVPQGILRALRQRLRAWPPSAGPRSSTSRCPRDHDRFTLVSDFTLRGRPGARHRRARRRASSAATRTRCCSG